MGGEMRGRKHRIIAIVGALVVLAATAVLAGAFSARSSERHVSKFNGGDPDARVNSKGTVIGEGPLGGFEAYLSAARTYPADVIPPSVAAQAEATFAKIAGKDAKTGDPGGKGHKWKLYGPTQDAMEPGVIAFSGATNSTASRVTAIAVSPDCDAKHCRLWVGVSGGGVWRTDNANAKDPEWKQLKPDQLDQNSVGTLTLDPSDKKGNTIYLGTGEANRCTSGCEAGVGLYKSTNGGDKWTKV